MKLKIILCIALLVTSVSGFSQNQEGQYSFEAGYGIGLSGKPNLTGSHYNIGFRYMFDPSWGVKVDFANDKYRTDANPETGINYTRISAQAVYNLGRDLGVPDFTGQSVNILAHGGLGYSRASSTELSQDDNMGNLIIGLTPQIYIFKNMSLQLDVSYVANLLQHFDYDGYYRFDGEPKSFTGGQLNASIGIVYYLGKRHSDYDWR
jgi:hypothetical protein